MAEKLEINIVIDEKDKMTLKTKGFENPIEIMKVMTLCFSQILTSLKTRKSGIIKPDHNEINQMMGQKNNLN